MHSQWKPTKVAALALGLFVFGVVSPAQEARALDGVPIFKILKALGLGSSLRVIGLTDNGRLVSFRSNTPHRTREIGPVTGLTGADTALVGIDFRVQDGLLYGVGNGGGIYTIDTTTAVATSVNLPLTIALSGTSFGVDFNPAANALRVISDTGQNLRHPFAGGLAGMTQNDTALALPSPATPPALGVTGAAYTNNDVDANTGTTLFDIDTVNDQVVLQSPANSGQLVPTGKLGVDAASAAGFDIYSALDGGVSVHNVAFATLTVNGTSGFYDVDLLTGQAILIRKFSELVVDIAIPLDQ